MNRFTNLLLHRVRIRGAVDHLYLNKYRTERLSIWDLNWMKDSRHFLNPRYNPNKSRFPKLLTDGSSRDNLLDTVHAKNSNWFHSYFRKSFPQKLEGDIMEMGGGVTTDFINEFYVEWLDALVELNIINEVKVDGQRTFCIEPSAIRVEKDVFEFSCTGCEDKIYSHDDLEWVEKGSCLSYRCNGHYEPSEQTAKNYYNVVYNRNRSPRIYAREHTGLLERRVRERLEVDFKKRPRYNSANTLVATSTLEMGIDIGNLNTAYNNSVPPLPSNFLQRIGRAGRKSGDALIVNFAKNQNHDLYYYADPLQMMEGEVNTPGCYLEAKDILKRHFTAYCFDCWAGENPNENNIPSFVRDLKLQARNLNESEFFVNRLSKFIKDNRLSLVSDFLKQYEKRIKEQVFPEIAQQMDSGQFYDHLLDVFEKIKNELDQIRERGKDIDSQIKLLNLAKGDPLFDEFLREKRNLRGVRKAIQSRNVLEHLTNVGVLPNYAFPETGVHLTAHVLSSSIEGSPNRSLDQDFEIVRPAVQAIKEFAPENYFYTQGYRFEISGVNTFDWSDKDVLQAKRFCSKCDYIENDIKAKGGNCPKCGDPSWSSATNKHQFAKLLSVKSFNSESKAILTDANDDRDIQNYHLMHFVNMNPETSAGALVLKDIPFGIEYVKNATITSVNFGRVDENDVRKVKINDTEVLTKGFVTCKYCGKSISATHLAKESKDYHYGYCKHRDIKYKPGETDEVFEEIYFFREMHTEVLKMVLPVQEFNTEADVRMFQAGLEIGLKQYFRGNPQHLRVLPYREYNQKTDKFDRFLLLYDTIPGGTGYLEQLFNQEEFTLLLKLSYETIRDCTCQLDGYDGCYKCIYSYGNQYQREDLSRKRAEEWFAKIYSKTEEWVPYSTGLTSVTNTGKIEESELE